MHEMALCESVLKMIEEEAANRQFSRVTAVQLEIGRLAAVEVEAMRFCFDVVARGSIVEGAVLEIVQPEGRAWCEQCAKTVSVDERYSPCSICGSYQLQITGGDEMR